MATPPTPRLTLPDPDRAPMTPLPAELLARILKLAQEGQSIAEQLQTRLIFEKVSWSWYLCDNKWRIVSVTGVDAIEKLCAVVAPGPRESRARTSRASVEAGGGGAEAVAESIAKKIKSLRVELTGVRFVEEDKAMVQLLSAVVKVETVEIVFARSSRARFDIVDGELAWASALAKLGNIKHFAIAASQYNQVSPDFPAAFIKELLLSWPKLESLAIKNCNASIFDQVQGAFSASPVFNSLEVVSAVGMPFAPSSLVRDLPPTTRSLTIKSSKAFGTDLSDGLDERLTQLARSLECVCLTDGVSRAGSRSEAQFWRLLGFTTQRGQLDNLLKHLDNVTELTISPITTADFASLAELKKLTKLRVLIGEWMPSAVESHELVALFANTTSIKHAELPAEVRETWTAEEKQEVEDAAQGKIELRWV